MKNYIASFVLLTLLCLPSFAASTNVISAIRTDPKPATSVVVEPTYYHAGEFSIEGYAASITKDFNTHRGGVGFGVSYFLTQNSGLKLDTFTSCLGGRSAIDIASASYVYRIPIKRSCPYGLVGGDYDSELRQWGAHLGVGLEHRVLDNVGLFVEARMKKVWNYSSPSAQGRAGVRLSF